MSYSVFSQTERTAQKIDEYVGDYYYEDEIARIDSALANLKSNDRLCIIGYGLPGTARRRVMRAYDYAIKARGIDSNRIIPVVGGFLDKQTVELWIIPEGSSVPIPSPAFVEQTFNVARKYDDFSLEGQWFSYQNNSVLLDGFANILKSNPELRGYLVVHKRRGLSCEYCYFQGKELKFASDLRQYLAETQSIASSRIKVIDKGFDGDERIELWIALKTKRLSGIGKPKPLKKKQSRKSRK